MKKGKMEKTMKGYGFEDGAKRLLQDLTNGDYNGQP